MAEPITQIKRALAQAETSLGLRLTLVGHHHQLHPRGQHLLGPRWQSHRTETVCDVGFGPQCVAHCRWQINHQLAAQPQAIATRCWKGVREIAVPLRSRDQHLGTLYAGTWRQATRPRAAVNLSATWFEAWHTLPVWDDALLATWRPLLQVVADGLAVRLAGLALPSVGAGGMRERIDAWFQFHATMPVTLADLADHLERSQSRAGALVREHFAQPFALELRTRRLALACELLRTTTLPVAEIAQQVGFADPAWFSRAFAAAYAASPRAWRQAAGQRDG